MTAKNESALDSYLNSLDRYPMLTPAEEIELGRLVQRGQALLELDRPLNKKERMLAKRALRAKQRFVEANMRLVVFLVKKYYKRVTHLEMLDLIQEGVIGLVRGVEKFDPSRGYKFSTYAYWWIRQAMMRSITSKEFIIKRPTGVGDLAQKMPKVMQALMTELGRSPTSEELAKALDIRLQDLEMYLQRAQQVLSLDYVRADEGGSALSQLIDLIPDPNTSDQAAIDESMSLELQMPMLNAGLAKLTEQERLFVKHRYGLGGAEVKTFEALGKQYGVSRERVRQVSEKAIRRLRYYMHHQQIDPPAEESAPVQQSAPLLCA
jgi:RNA polymerase primary sigma factor